MIPFTKAVLATLLVVPAKIVASDTSLLPTDFSWWFWQSSIVVGSRLYIDAGEIWARWGGSINASAAWNYQTLAVDLTTDWDTNTIDSSVFLATNKSLEQQPTREPDMFYDPRSQMVYTFGGWAYPEEGCCFDGSVLNQVWGFPANNNGSTNWEPQQQMVVTNSLSGQVVAGASTANSPTAHYNLGGATNSANALLDELLVYNYTNQSWTNQTLPSKYYLWGQGQYIPAFGNDGIILFLGGLWPTAEEYNDPSARAGLSSVLVYDIETDTFFNPQPTSSTINSTSIAPPERFRFCSVGAGNGIGNSSYEIFIFGGTIGSTPDTATATALATVYILTLPAFHWIQTTAIAPTFRADHTCAIIGNRQMISIGGFPDPATLQDLAPDPWNNGMQILDMVDLVWREAYDASAAEYQPPGVVTQYYESGGSRYPASWSDPKLADVFKQVTTSSSTPTSTPAVGGTGVPSPRTRRGAIVGGAVGGGAVLVIIIVLVSWYVRKKRTRQGATNELDGSGPQRFQIGEKNKERLSELGIHERPQELMSNNRHGDPNMEQSPSSDSFRIARKPVELSV